MEIKASLNNLRVSPRKSREVIDLIRGKDVKRAQDLLRFTVKRSAEPVLKLLNSAVASATHNFRLDESNLYISKITVDEGPKLKRWHAMSRGRAYPIYKRTSKINIVLSEINTEPKNKKLKAESKKKKAEIKIEKTESKKRKIKSKTK